jgi:hypothetical protein
MFEEHLITPLRKETEGKDGDLQLINNNIPSGVVQ